MSRAPALPFPAYVGSEPYLFASYSHRDAKAVYGELTRLNALGFNVWYDEGISPGQRWPDELANAINQARLLLFFVTSNSIASEHCKNELDFAIAQQIPILPVYLQPTELPPGIQLSIGNKQAILKYQTDQADYERKLLTALSAQFALPPAATAPAAEPTPGRMTSIVRLLVPVAVLIGGIAWWQITGRPAQQDSLEPVNEALRSAREAMRAPRSSESLELAIRNFEAARDLQPDSAAALAGLCEAQLARFRFTGLRRAFEDGVAACETAIAVDPESWEVRQSMGALYRHQGDYARAIKELERAEALNPESASIQYQLGATNQAWALVAEDMTAMSERRRKARSAFERAREVEPQAWLTHADLGDFLYEWGDYEGALDQFEIALSMTPEAVSSMGAESAPDQRGLWVSKGAALYMAGQHDLARAAWLHAEEVGGDAPLWRAWTWLGIADYYDHCFSESALWQRRAIADDMRIAERTEPGRHELLGRLAETCANIDGAQTLSVELNRRAIDLAEAARAFRRDNATAAEGAVDEERLDKNWQAIGALMIYYARIGDAARVDALRAELLRLAPYNAEARYFSWLALELSGATEAAERERMRAAAWGFPESLMAREPEVSDHRCPLEVRSDIPPSVCDLDIPLDAIDAR